MRKTKPTKRSECIAVLRPCPWISCKHHMLWIFLPRQFLTSTDKLIDKFLNTYSDDEILEMIEKLGDNSCTLDVVRHGEMTLQEVGDIMGITRERVRQIEFCKSGGAIRRLRHPSKMKYVEDFRGLE